MTYNLSLIEVATLLGCIQRQIDTIRKIKGDDETLDKYLNEEIEKLVDLFTYLEDPFLEAEDIMQGTNEK